MPACDCSDITMLRPRLGKLTHVFVYRDMSGDSLFARARYATPEVVDNPKTFRYCHHYNRSLAEHRTALYKRPELEDTTASAKPTTSIYLVEGEKDVEAARARRLSATTTHRGTEFTVQDAEPFRGYAGSVVIVADRDHLDDDKRVAFAEQGVDYPGSASAVRKYRALLAVGVKASQIKFREAVEGKDLEDHLRSGKRAADMTLLTKGAVFKRAPKEAGFAAPRDISELAPENLPSGPGLQTFIGALAAKGYRVEEIRPGRYKTNCPHPEHNDNNPSFEFEQGAKGVAGDCKSRSCTTGSGWSEICEGLGIKPSDTFDRPEEADRVAWAPMDLGPILRGEAPQIMPTVLERKDGNCLLYPGLVNMLFGASEVGKTWLAFLAILQEIRKGNTVLYFDLEDTAQGIVRRLLDLGISKTEIERHFLYVNHDGLEISLKSRVEIQPILDFCEERKPALIVVDAMTELVATQPGMSSNSQDDIAVIGNKFLKPLAATGACVLVIDHSGNDNSERVSGSQHKKSFVQGASINVRGGKPFSKAHAGSLTLLIGKDRPGGIEHTLQGNKRIAGEMHVTPLGEGRLELVISDEVTQRSKPVEQKLSEKQSNIVVALSELGATSPIRATNRKAVLEFYKNHFKAITDSQMRDELAKMKKAGAIQGRQQGSGTTAPWLYWWTQQMQLETDVEGMAS